MLLAIITILIVLALIMWLRYYIVKQHNLHAEHVNKVYEEILSLRYEGQKRVKAAQTKSLLTENELLLISTILTMDQCIVDFVGRHPEAANDDALQGAIHLVGVMLDDLSPEEREMIDSYIAALAMTAIMNAEDEEEEL